MAIKNNNAERLLCILNNIKAGENNEPVHKAIKRVFADIEQNSEGVMIGQIYELANMVIKQINKIPDSCPEVHLKWTSNVYKALSTLALSANTNINNFKNIYTDADFAYLRAASVELSRNYPDPDIDNDTLVGMYNEISEMIESLQEDKELEISLKNFIIDKLFIIQDAINNSKYIGYHNVITETESAFAGTFFRIGDADKFNTLKATSIKFAHYIDWLGRLFTLWEGANIGYKSLSTVMHYFLNT